MVSEGFQKGLMKPCGFRAVLEGSETVGGVRGVSDPVVSEGFRGV